MTNRELITSALRMLTVLDANETANAEDAALGLEELNDLMADLLADDGIDLGYVRQDSLTNDVPCDDEEISAIKPLLAVRLHSYFPSVAIPETVPARAMNAYNRLLRDAVLANLEESSLSNLPRGEGHRGRYNIYTGE